MKDLHENFAAIAVISKLYEAGRDIYDVLAAYLQMVIITDNLNGFTSAEIADRINKTNSFSVNESIVKTALKRLGLKRDHGTYSVGDEFAGSFDYEMLAEQTRQNRILVDKIYSYIEEKSRCKLSAEEKQGVENEFYKYLLNPEYSGDYSLFINQFVMDNSMDTSFHDVILRIKEGLLIYEGISFSPDVGQSGRWEFPLDIYLEMEVIFFIAGYNGIVHKELYDQLLRFVKDINLSSHFEKRKAVRLFYTQDVKAEIDNYFTSAEMIFEKHEIVDPSKKAMLYILEGVTSKSDIQLKKVQLFTMLNCMDITEQGIDFFSETNSQYNSITGDTYEYNIQHIESDRGDEYICKCTDKVNQINILRKNKNGSLKEAGCVLLTANGTIFKCAYMPNAFSSGDTPKAVNIDYLINRFWYKLNKGLGKGNSPKTIDILSRSQMVLSAMTSTKVSQAYEDIKQRYAAGQITEMEVAGIISELRKVSKNPEDISGDQLEEQVSFLTDYDLTEKIEQMRREEVARQNDRDTIARLEAQAAKSEALRKKDAEDRDKREKELEERITSLETRNAESQNTIRSLIEREDKRLLRRKKVIRGILFSLGVLVLAVVLFLGCRFLFKFDKSISGMISIVIAIVPQFFGPLKKQWKKQVIDYQLKK